MSASLKHFETFRKRAVSLIGSLLLLAALLMAPWMEEYSAHRAVTGVPSDTGAESEAPSVAATTDSALVADPSAESLESVLITPNPDALKRLVSLIKASRSELLLNVYLLTEPSVVDALVAAKKRGVDVKVILEKDPYKLPGSNRKARDRLLSAGVDVFSSKDAFAFVHAKYAVADGANYVFSTGNYTKSTFSKNREFFVFGQDVESAAFLRSVFLADFRGTPFVSNVPERFYLAPLDARKKLLRFVEGARKTVTVLAPSVSDDEFVRALSERAASGQRVRVCLMGDAEEKDIARFGSGVAVTRSK